MADRRRIVTIAPDGTVTTVKDLEDSSAFYSVRDSFTVKSASRKTVMAQRQRRYGGAFAAGESHENGAISWKALVRGASADAVNTNVESMLQVLETGRLDYLVEWRPDGATASTYYEVRGPATWSLTYQWAQYAGSQSMYVDVEIPVGPLARGAVGTQSISSTTFPLHKTDLSSITGSAPALCDVSIRASGGSAAPVWALIGWWKRPGSPLSGSVAPAGIIEAETGTLTSFSTSPTDAATKYRGADGIKYNTASGTTASAYWVVDPSTMAADDFTRSTVDVEWWARVRIPSTMVSPVVKLSLEPNAGASFGAPQYAQEYGSTGKTLDVPSSGDGFRFVRLGTLTMPVDTAAPLKWNVKLAASWSASSTGEFGVDYLVPVPARQRACSKTGVANDTYYPDFISSTSDTTKTIRSDLSGRVASAAGNAGPDSGLGGAPIELPPGNVDMVFVLSSAVADEPASSTSMQLSHTSTSATLTITPRYYLVR